MNIDISAENIKDLLYYETKPLIELNITYPQIGGHISRNAERNFNFYYLNSARVLNFKTRTETYRQAVAQYKYSKRNGFPFNLFSVIQTYEVTYLQNNYASLYIDIYTYSGGAHGMTERTGYTWNLRTGRRMVLSDFFPRNSNWRSIILNEVKRQIEQDPQTYFENAKQLAERYFDPRYFYLSANGITVFYPLYAIAPYASGIRTFEIPVSDITVNQGITVKQ